MRLRRGFERIDGAGIGLAIGHYISLVVVGRSGLQGFLILAHLETGGQRLALDIALIRISVFMHIVLGCSDVKATLRKLHLAGKSHLYADLGIRLADSRDRIGFPLGRSGCICRNRNAAKACKGHHQR